MIASKKSTLISTFATLLTLVVIVRPSAAQSYNVAGDFSTATNPNGAWSYGSSTSLASAFISSTIPTNNYAGFGLNGWLGTSDGSGTPYILRNVTSHNVTNAVTVYQPGQLAQHPGAQDQYSVVRWTAPFSGTFSLNATFTGLSLAGDTADVHILLDGISIFNSTVTGSPSPASFSTTGNFSTGDKIDFAVGFGSNGDNHDDTTGLSATIVPEPASLGLVVIGLASLLSFRILERK